MTRDLEYALQQYYGHAAFREGQKEIIEDVLAGKDVLGILPTGSGKSLCYQLPARMVDGAVLVVSPLISLMIDQEKQLVATGFKQVIAITSFLSKSTKERVMHQLEQYKLIYVSPEMLQTKQLIDKLRSIPISVFVVDEAHCISQWGHEFRPDYLKLHQVVETLNYPTVLALSATATPDVQQDIIEQLKCERMVRHVYPMDRENIALSIEKVKNNQEKLHFLIDTLNKFPGPTMIYFSSRMWAEKVTDELCKHLPNLRTAYYHGGMEQADRLLIQQQFMNNQLDVVCCTSAFGMGINKKNIRLVVHFHLPTQIESYIQEIGRAGRDGKQSVSLLLFAPHDVSIPKRLIESELPSPMMINIVLQFLKERANTNQMLPDDKEVLEILQINEIQWRFLSYHFEKHGMIIESRILYNENIWMNRITSIQKVIKVRSEYKEQKLQELLQWAEGSACRRTSLFSFFQQTVKKPTGFCCDVCDFTFKTWEPSVVEQQHTKSDWRSAFKDLMLQGEIHVNEKPSRNS
ncbi:ATP-dependent DNA helicase [Aquibacillus sp. 3ASR75-11]|uniref:ATP-dependent DNA helicase RecQ n=1 Tax=Terrihalobacillus insolitus TaxID=2950438 RepID=A0A9X4AM18_9BACI|nr:ATP-dependent DNA helicase RecQ [Terrihalobacillus insolitus]MDC3413084.1 ATP-dependent DNA helicase [Terrihalobacillus insolitus]MDC3424826.1 ATP-dependent DNA helicase [Terrihalobacillus insolitus]